LNNRKTLRQIFAELQINQKAVFAVLQKKIYGVVNGVIPLKMGSIKQCYAQFVMVF
jgi:hypothetical protein